MPSAAKATPTGGEKLPVASYVAVVQIFEVPVELIRVVCLELLREVNFLRVLAAPYVNPVARLPVTECWVRPVKPDLDLLFFFLSDSARRES